MADYGGPQGFGGTTPGGPNAGGALGGTSTGSGYGGTSVGGSSAVSSAHGPVSFGVDPVTGEVQGTVTSAAESAAAAKALSMMDQQQAVAKANLIAKAPPPKRATYQPSMTAINNEIASMRDRLGELAAMKDKSNEDLNEMGELNSLFGLNPTEDMGLTESLRYNVTSEDFKSDLSQLATNPLFSFASAAMGDPLGIASLIGKGIYGAVTSPVDTVRSAAQSVGDWFGGLDVQPAPAETFGGEREATRGRELTTADPLYYQNIADEALTEEGVAEEEPFNLAYAPVYYGVNNWPGAISYAKNGGLASLIPKRRRI